MVNRGSSLKEGDMALSSWRPGWGGVTGGPACTIEELEDQGGREPVTDDFTGKHTILMWMHDPDRDKRPDDRKRDEHDWAIKTERDFL